jgi:branched-subunit amino acid permease
MNRRRITLTLVLLLALLVLWRPLWRVAPVLYLLYPAAIFVGALCGWLWAFVLLRERWIAGVVLVSVLLVAYHALSHEHVDLLLLQAIENVEFRLPWDATARSWIGFAVGFILGGSLGLLINLLIKTWAAVGKTDAR